MAYTFEQVLAVDPSNPANVARAASITIFAPGDAAKTPLTLTDTNGSPLPNPLTVNANGFGPAFMHATLDRVAWEGGGFTGFLTSYEGMKEEAIEARTAAEQAAANAATAGADAAAVASAALAGAVADAEAAASAAANSASLVGAPADTAIAAAINGSGTATKTALNATFAPAEAAVTFINHGSDPAVARGTAPGRRIWIGSVLPNAFIAGTDLLMKPVRTPVLVPTTGLQARFVAEEAGFTNNATVTSWAAHTGSYTLTATGGPVYKFENGRGYVQTDGVDDYLTDATLDRTQPNSLVIVARYVATGTNKYLFATATGNPNQQSLAADGTGLRQLYAGSGSTLRGSAENTSWHVYIATFNGLTSELMVNGTVDAAGDAKTNPADGLRLGAGPAGDGFANLQIAEVISYTRALTTSEKSSLSSTLAAQYGF